MSLVAVGAAILRPVGLSAQRIGSRSKGRVPGKATFSGMDYQVTGLDEQRVRIEFATVPLLVGGLDCLGILTQIHHQQVPVPYLRLGRAYAATLAGLVIVESLDVDEDRIHPFTGVGRVVSGEMELILLGSSAAIGTGVSTGLDAVASLGRQVFL